jgi:hypothetical protein
MCDPNRIGGCSAARHIARRCSLPRRSRDDVGGLDLVDDPRAGGEIGDRIGDAIDAIGKRAAGARP